MSASSTSEIGVPSRSNAAGSACASPSVTHGVQGPAIRPPDQEPDGTVCNPQEFAGIVASSYSFHAAVKYAPVGQSFHGPLPVIDGFSTPSPVIVTVEGPAP